MNHIFKFIYYYIPLYEKKLLYEVNTYIKNYIRKKKDNFIMIPYNINNVTPSYIININRLDYIYNFTFTQEDILTGIYNNKFNIINYLYNTLKINPTWDPINALLPINNRHLFYKYIEFLYKYKLKIHNKVFLLLLELNRFSHFKLLYDNHKYIKIIYNYINDYTIIYKLIEKKQYNYVLEYLQTPYFKKMREKNDINIINKKIFDSIIFKNNNAKEFKFISELIDINYKPTNNYLYNKYYLSIEDLLVLLDYGYKLHNGNYLNINKQYNLISQLIFNTKNYDNIINKFNFYIKQKGTLDYSIIKTVIDIGNLKILKYILPICPEPPEIKLDITNKNSLCIDYAYKHSNINIIIKKI
tara:strand:- start:2861 stop:3931 length:1071 start_codon:yes stop_codon:yes gene_type:complete